MQAASLSILELRRHVLSQSLFFRLLATFGGGRPSPPCPTGHVPRNKKHDRKEQDLVLGIQSFMSPSGTAPHHTAVQEERTYPSTTHSFTAFCNRTTETRLLFHLSVWTNPLHTRTYPMSTETYKRYNKKKY